MHLLVTNIFFEPFSYGGATVVAEQVVRELARQTDWKITVVSASSRMGIHPYHYIRTEGAGVTHIIIGLPPAISGTDTYLNSKVEEVFGQILNSLEPDAVHAHCVQNIGAGILRAAADRNIPYIVSIHDFWWLCERQFMIDFKGQYCGNEQINPDSCRTCVDNVSATRVRDLALRKILNDAHAITYPSAFTKNLYENSGILPQPGSVWQNGVRLPAPEFFAKQAARRENDPRLSFGFVGGPSQIKGWPVMRQAFAKMTRDDFVVNLVDASADRSWWSPKDFADLPGEWRIVSRYTQDGLDDFYSKIDVLLFLSQWKETFGLTIREAAARGLDIIQTEGGGTTEYDSVEDSVMVQIGDGADTVARAIEAVFLGKRRSHPAIVHDYAKQAAEFIKIVDAIS